MGKRYRKGRSGHDDNDITYSGNGVDNAGSGTINVSTATSGNDGGNASIICEYQDTGVINRSSGTVNAGTVMGNFGVDCFSGSGTVNVETASGSNGHFDAANYGDGTINVVNIPSNKTSNVQPGKQFHLP